MAQSTASSEDALLLLYRRIGTPAGLSVDRFETVEAILAGREVWRELRESGREAR